MSIAARHWGRFLRSRRTRPAAPNLDPVATRQGCAYQGDGATRSASSDFPRWEAQGRSPPVSGR
jgi:hypothetical protein